MAQTAESPSAIQVETSTTTTSEAIPPLGFYPSYIKNVPGILKTTEIVLSLAVFICAELAPASFEADLVRIVSMGSLLTTLILLLFYLTNVIHRLLGQWRLIEFVYYGIVSLLYFVAVILAAIYIPIFEAVEAAANFFASVLLVVYGIDTYFQFKKWREHSHEDFTTSTYTATTNFQTEL